MKPTFFKDASSFRQWLTTHHDSATELLMGFYKKASGKPSITYQEALDEALCFGWIDGVRKRVDEASYTIRFTPRRPKSAWSRVNIARVDTLSKAGLMQPPGVDAFERRDETKYDSYYDARNREFDEASERAIRADRRAWAFLQAQSAWFRGGAAFWVMSAKREETRARRLASLIEHLREERIPPALALPGRKPARAR